ncbi:MAG: LysR family transcriptional regulator, partial [Burkholderiales bacterium]|nr:LysR family transcriptional regulator [Burkholderiales bacterium]
MRANQHSRQSLARTLKLQQLAIFEKVVQAGSILAASHELAMTQPAVSKAVQELERHLGAPLFVRGKRGVALSEFGLEFERHAKSMLGELRHLADGLNAWQSGATGRVVV